MVQRMPSQTEVIAIRQQYPAGTRLELIHMDDPFTQLSVGDRGTVQGVDDLGQIMMTWDNGGSLSLIPGVDEFRRIDK